MYGIVVYNRVWNVYIDKIEKFCNRVYLCVKKKNKILKIKSKSCFDDFRLGMNFLNEVFREWIWLNGNWGFFLYDDS